MSVKPVQLTGPEKVCVLTHVDTGRILCFCFNDAFAETFERQGYIKHEIHHAHEFDRWAKLLREQQKVEDQAEDAAYLDRENAVRQRLRSDLRSKLSSGSVAERKAIESALHCLDYAEDKRKRYRQESFMVQEAFEAGANVGEELVNRLMTPKVKQ